MSDSLDPEDWAQFRERARAMLDAVIDRMERYDEGAVWNAPEGVQPDLTPDKLGQGEAAADAALRGLLPYGVGNTHPRFFGWVHGAGTPSGLMADIIAAALNANCGGRNTGAIKVERAVIDWARQLFGLPDDASGLITTGTSAATIIALKVARDEALGADVRETGVRDQKSLVGYTSAGGHSCLDRAFDLLGLGKSALRKIEMDERGRLDLAALDSAIERDRADGLTPFIVCATAGTVNRGAIDNLSGCADIAAREALWFHVDAAFAAALQLSDAHRHRLSGIERASSIGFDFHKWMQVNYDAGCVLIRDEAAHRAAFSDDPDYLTGLERGLGSAKPWPVDYGPELSRGFRALKVWAQLIEHGPDRLGQIVDANIAQAAYLADRVTREPGLELLSYEELNICCFRYVGDGSADDLDGFNQELVIRLQESGIAAPSTTRIDGKLAIRVNITNHRTQLSDMDVLVEGVLEMGG
tara:strand:- start:52915 stop:54327 length:1413 start_codon:yes stop_codon:yes gene_type:complete